MKIIDIVHKSIKKAEQKGYKSPFDFTYEKGRIIDGKTYYAIIFDKDFCKSIWSDERTSLNFFTIGKSVSLWEWHLKNMVISDSPIKYLADNIDLDTWEKVENQIFN